MFKDLYILRYNQIFNITIKKDKILLQFTEPLIVGVIFLFSCGYMTVHVLYCLSWPRNLLSPEEAAINS